MNNITGGFADIDVRTDINSVGLKVDPESSLSTFSPLPITMISFGILFFVSLHFVVLVNAMQGRAVYRNEAQDFSVGEKSISLLTSRDAIIINSGRSDRLLFFCVREPNCLSFNIAAYPDVEGIYRCELLATDKYTAKSKFHANAAFHHYSAKVRGHFFNNWGSLKSSSFLVRSIPKSFS